MKSASIGSPAVSPSNARHSPRRHFAGCGCVPFSRGSARGFTLLEALIAITILALSLSVLLPSHSAGIRALAAVDEHLQARLLAQSILAEWSQDRVLRVGSIQGSFDKFAWTLTTAPLERKQPQNASAGGWELYRLALVVSWGRNRQIELQTLRMGRAQ
jgi:prepilin-type N-terminal cleavage/methylation domain-containing protein